MPNPMPMPMNEFEELTQKKMVEVLRDFDQQHGTDHAVGQSRARKADLEAIYAKALEALATEENAEPGPGEVDIKDNGDGTMTAKAGPGVDLRDHLPPKTAGVQTGRLRSDKPNEGGKPQAAPPEEEVESNEPPTQTVLLRREHDVFFFIRTGNERRPLSSKESWMLSRVKKLRGEIGPVYVSGDGRRANPSRKAKQELRRLLHRLNRPHGIVCVSDEAVKRMHEAQAQGQGQDAQL